MDWSKIGEALLEKGLPLLGGALLGPAGAAGGKLIASALGVGDDPEEVSAALQANPEAFVKLRTVELENATELRRMVIEAETTRLREVNTTMREEEKSEDWFVRRARPAFLWVTAFSIFVEVLIALVVVLAAPAHIGDLATLYNALAIPQSIAAAMCGVYLKKRSDDKALEAGVVQGPGLLGSFMAKFANPA